MKTNNIYILCLVFLNFNPVIALIDIHVFGDSHVFYSFHEFKTDFTKFIAPTNCECFFNYNQEFFHFIIHPSIATTMHRVGRDKTSFLNPEKLKLKNCLAIFNFGEVDCRCHIEKQVKEKNRTLEEVINTLVQNYLDFVKTIQEQSFNVRCIILSIIPPTDNGFNPAAPIYGDLKKRILITNKLNQELKYGCRKADLLFLDPYYMFKDQDGALILEMSDRVVHVNPNINYLIKELILNNLYKHRLL